MANAPAGKLAHAGQPRETDAQNHNTRAHAGHQHQGIADQLQQLGLQQVGPDVEIDSLPAEQQHQKRHQDQRSRAVRYRAPVGFLADQDLGHKRSCYG